MPRKASQTQLRSIDTLERKAEREKQARQRAETLLEAKSRDLSRANQELAQLAAQLEQRVAERTAELNNEIAMRREAEEKLQDTGVFLDTVIENLPGMLCIKDAKDLRFILFNRAGEELLGYGRSAFVGKSDYDFFPKEQADHFVARDREVMNSLKRQVTEEEPIATRHKGVRLLRTTKVPVLDKHGNPRYLLALSEDITERHATEQQLRQAVKMEAVGQLTGGIAHDFNNLLSVIIGSLDLVIERKPADPTVKALVQGALDGALRGADLVQRLLAFSRKQTLRPMIVELNERLPQIAAILRRTLGEHIVVETKLGAGLWATTADPSQIEEAILNLAINARDAMPTGGRLTIETANVCLDDQYASQHADVTAGEYVLLAVSDSGAGMEPEVVERAFEPFFTTKAVNKGSGLGLSMVYGFVKQSGGHIKIYSEVGHGTTVKIYLPRSDAAYAAETAAESPEETAAGRDDLILVVEDNEGVRSVTLQQLSDLGYRTLEADNAKAALKVLDDNPDIALLFTDIVMPGGMTGCELAREAVKRRPGLRILLTSGYTAQAVTNGYHDIEGLELLNKPFRKRDLAAKLTSLLEATA
jgi:PAS domain S-box-containing protein